MDFYICWPGKSFWSGAKESYSSYFEAEGCPRTFGKWVFSLFKDCKTDIWVDGEI